ncbi:MAG: TonB-dependent receptor [Paludibacteraceae bacterium]|nr:TonB-dependent receptor [Paludibacteraceae bacterium]
MNKKTLIFFSILACLLVSNMPILAQDHHHHHHHEKKSDAHIAGHVLDAHTQEHLPFVNVQVKGTSLGCLTDESGHFYLKNLPEGQLTLVFSMIGYESVEKSITLHRDTLVEMNIAIEEASFLIDNVVVTANKYATKQKEVATIVNVISPLIIESTTSNSMADVLNFQTGLRVEETCSNCGVPQIRINGLEGQYTQILMDSRPIFSSLASVYGLEQLPAGMVDRIEVIRGGGSALYGANAIAGVVNIITKEPARNFFNVSNSSSFTETGAYDINTALNASVVSENQKAGIFIFGVQRNREHYDRDSDGYSDIPLLNSTTVGFRSFFKTSDYSKLTAEYHHTTEYRRGGYGIDSLQPHESPLCEQLRHNIDAATMKWDMYSADNKHFVSAYTSFQHIGRNSYFGTNYNPNAYGKSTDIVSVTGAQYRFSYPCGWMNADLSAGAEYSYNQLRDQILGYDRNTLQRVHLGGGYVQNEWKNKYLSVLVGGRLEQHSLLEKPVFSPRANVRYSPIANSPSTIADLILRMSYASGYRAPQIYEEDLHVGAVGGEVSLISLDENLRPEYSHSVSGSIDMYARAGKWDMNLTLEGFFTQLNDVFTLVENGHDAQGNLLLTRTNASGARVAGMNIEAKVGYGHLLTFQAGYTYNHSRYIEPLQWSENPNIAPQRRMFRTPEHYGYFLLNIEPVKNFHILTNGKVTGSMLVQHFAGYVPEDEEVVTPTFFEWDFKLCYDIPLYKHYTLEINAGVKNVLDHFQKDIDKGMDRDAGYIYGPAAPRTYFAGVNLKI